MQTIKAEIQDLYYETWLRARNKGQIVWTMKDGQTIPIKEMTNSHLRNTINMLRKQALEEEIAYEALSSIGDTDFNG